MAISAIDEARTILRETFEQFGIGNGKGWTENREPALALRFRDAKTQKAFEDHIASLPSTDPAKAAYLSVPTEKRVIGRVTGQSQMDRPKFG
jgi:hypothetical protein